MKLIHVLKGHDADINELKVFPDGRIVSAADNGIRIWDPNTGKCLSHLDCPERTCPQNLCLLANGAVAGLKNEGEVIVWNPDTGERLSLSDRKLDFTCLASLPDGGVITGCIEKGLGRMEHTIRIWDPDTGECLKVLEGHVRKILCVETLPDGRIASGSGDCTVRVWKPDAGECIKTLEFPYPVMYIRPLPDGKIACASILPYDEDILRVWDLKNESYCDLQDWEEFSYVSCLICETLPDKIVGCVDDGRTVAVWDATTGGILREIEQKSTCYAVSSTATGNIVIGGSSGEISVWDSETGVQIASGECPGYHMINCIAALPDGGFCCSDSVARNPNNDIWVWSLTDD